MEKIVAIDPLSHSTDLVAENIERLRELFPEAVTEDKGSDGKVSRRIDFAVLQELLGGELATGEEKYGLNWYGKRTARRLALTPSVGTLLPAPEESVDWDTTKNLMIEGDNLEVLKLLQKSYTGKVKMIYIDPPYNTGNDFVYKDDFKDSIGNYQRITGQTDKEGVRLSSNSESSGRFHTDWLNMLYPRVMLARTLLKEHGVILIAIDDHEQHNARVLLDSVFGAENYIGTFIWDGGRKNDAKMISIGHDYTIVYARNFPLLRERKTKWREKKEGLREVYDKETQLRKQHGDDYGAIHKDLLKWFGSLPEEHPSKAHDHFTYVDQRGIYFPDNLRSPNPRPNLVFDWKGYKPHPNGWAYGRDKMAELDAEDRLSYPSSKKKRIKIKSYLREHETWAPKSVFYKDRRASSKALTSLMEKEVFDYPKDVGVLSRFISYICEQDDLVLDFFAGSGSIGHAIFDSAAQGKSYHFILVQLPELVAAKDDEDEDDDTASQGEVLERITELTKDRLRRAGNKIKSETPMFHGDLGFRVFKLNTTSVHPWDPTLPVDAQRLIGEVDNILPERTEQDLLYELLLKRGLELTTSIIERNLAGKQVFAVSTGDLITCLDSHITEANVEELANGIIEFHKELAPPPTVNLETPKAKPAKFEPPLVVFRDTAFVDDVTKSNLTEILKQHGLTDVRSL